MTERGAVVAAPADVTVTMRLGIFRYGHGLYRTAALSKSDVSGKARGHKVFHDDASIEFCRVKSHDPRVPSSSGVSYEPFSLPGRVAACGRRLLKSLPASGSWKGRRSCPVESSTPVAVGSACGSATCPRLSVHAIPASDLSVTISLRRNPERARLEAVQ
jgi:hypothetical protein